MCHFRAYTWHIECATQSVYCVFRVLGVTLIITPDTEAA